MLRALVCYEFMPWLILIVCLCTSHLAMVQRCCNRWYSGTGWIMSIYVMYTIYYRHLYYIIFLYTIDSILHYIPIYCICMTSFCSSQSYTLISSSWSSRWSRSSDLGWRGGWTGPWGHIRDGWVAICWGLSMFTRPGKHTKSYWKCWFIVDFPINSMVDLSSSLCKRLPEGITFFNRGIRGTHGIPSQAVWFIGMTSAVFSGSYDTCERT